MVEDPAPQPITRNDNKGLEEGRGDEGFDDDLHGEFVI